MGGQSTIAALRLPRQNRQYPSWVPATGVLTCIGLMAFLSPDAWIIGSIGILLGGAWFFVHRKTSS